MTPSLRPHALEEQWILARIDAVREEVEAAWGRFDFAAATSALYHLTFDDFCDWYAEAIKPRLYDGEKDAIATALVALERLLALLHPVLPHVTEEIWSYLPHRRARLIVSPWPEPDPAFARRRRRARPRPVRRADVPPQRRARRARDRGRAAHLRRRSSGRSARRPTGTSRPSGRGCSRRSPAPRACSRTSASSRTRRRPSSTRSARSSSATAPTSQPSSPPRRGRGCARAGSRIGDVAWLATLSPWPTDGFGLERMRALLAALGDPQRGLPAVHVVGTNGKSTTTRMVEELLLAEGIVAGAYLSPHVRRWAERIRVDGARGRPRARARRACAPRPSGSARRSSRRSPPRRSSRSATAGVDGRGRRGRARRPARRDERPRPHAGRRAHERRARAHRRARHDAGGDRRARSSPSCDPAARSSSASRSGSGSPGARGRPRSRSCPAATRRRSPSPRRGVPRPRRRPAPRLASSLPGRLERRPGEIRDGAHNPDGVRWLVERLRPGRFTLCVSMLADKDVDAMLDGLATLGDRLVATTSSNARALPADELARHARGRFDAGRGRARPVARRSRARTRSASQCS